MNLIVTATGNVGGALARLLRAAGKPVRSLTRNAGNRPKLEAAGIECAVGDLQDPASLAAACKAARTVVSLATGVFNGEPGALHRIDRDGQLALVAAAEAAGVEHFVFISFPPSAPDFPLQSAKRAVEDRLRSSGKLAHTILQPTYFMESWLSPALGFDPAAGTVRLFGAGERPASWIAVEDVARFTAATVDNHAAHNKTLQLGGPDTLSPLQVVELCEQLSGKSIARDVVPEATLEAQLRAAGNALEATFAGLMLGLAHISPVDLAPARAALSIGPTISVRDHVKRLLAASR